MNADPPSTAAASGTGPVVDVADTQDDVPVDDDRWAVLLAAVLAAEGVGPGASASLSFVAADEMAELNREHLGGDGPTDVLAFPIDGPVVATGEGGPPPLVGDVVVCPAVAAHQAAERDGAVEDEIALLVVHGGLHLMGHDHRDDAEREAMWDRQRELLIALWGVAPEPDQHGVGR